MKILSFSLFALCLVSILFFACKPKSGYGVNDFDLGTEFELGAGKTAKLKDGDLRVTLNTIGEDSRCPEGVNCMWAGKVVANITLGHSEGSQTLNFSLDAKPKGPTTKNFKGYKIRLHDVSPYPKDGVKIEKNQYTVRLSVMQ